MSERPDHLDGAIAPAANTTLFGHEAAETFLAGAYRTGRIHHAVLIEGPEGIGKATLAFRFANHILAHPDPAEAPTVMADPDSGSPIFRQIAAGASHDLLHLARPVDEKSGRVKSAITIDEVRRAGRFLGQTSGTGNWRIVIVDPADDLNRAAANAILKILEEPPRRALFLVLSHAPGRLLPTIRSRCLPLRLQPLGRPALEKALGHLGFSADTGGKAGDEMRRAIAGAQGSVARCLQMLRNGGADILEALDRITAAGLPAARADMHALADALTARDREGAYGFLIETLQDRFADAARVAALGGDLRLADRLARRAAETAETVATAEAYNLDRKQTILSLISSLMLQEPGIQPVASRSGMS